MSEKVPFTFRKKKHVTLPLFKLEKKVEYYFRIEGAMHLGKKIDSGSEAQQKKEPATLMQVTNLTTGEMGQIICPVVLQKELIEAYPGDAYVGKCFAIEIVPVPNKRYNLVQITEIEMDETPTTPAIDSGKKKAA